MHRNCLLQWQKAIKFIFNKSNFFFVANISKSQFTCFKATRTLLFYGEVQCNGYSRKKIYTMVIKDLSTTYMIHICPDLWTMIPFSFIPEYWSTAPRMESMMFPNKPLTPASTKTGHWGVAHVQEQQYFLSAIQGYGINLSLLLLMRIV